MRLLLTAVLIVVAGYLLGQYSDSRQPKVPGVIHNTAYFKDGRGNRILAFEFSSDYPLAEIRATAQRQARTPGQNLFMVFYPAGTAGIPRSGFNALPDYQTASDLLFDAPELGAWRYAYRVFLNGSAEFVDCELSTDAGMCR